MSADNDHMHLSGMRPADAAPIILVFGDDWQRLVMLRVSVFESLLAIHR
jgi:hypothetical protein